MKNHMTYNYNFSELFKNVVDMNQVFATQRRNLEAFSAASQVAVETAQEISRRQAELARANVENMLRASKELFANTGSPEANIAKQSDFAKAMFENTLSNLREVSEMVTKSSFEAFDVLNRRAAESIEEISKVSNSAPKKKSA
jgi:phasin family protein